MGTYCEPGPYFDAKGEGLLSCTLDLTTGHLESTATCKSAGNATFMAKDSRTGTLVVARDKYFSDGEVHSFAIEADGRLNPLSWVPSPGQATCHISIAPDSQHVFVSAYADATVSVHPFDGAVLAPALRTFQYFGASIDADRQEAAHAHQAVVAPLGRWLYVCDLGSDKVWIHDLRDLANEAPEYRSAEVPAGLGPRHLVFHPTLNLVYVFCELQARVLVCEVDAAQGGLTIREQVATLPDSYAGPASGAAIKLHPSTQTLYVSNRAHDSISVFCISKADGGLSLAGRFESLGRDPRDFEFDRSGRWLLSANQSSGTVIPFEIESQTGLPTGRVGEPLECGTPVCVVFD